MNDERWMMEDECFLTKSLFFCVACVTPLQDAEYKRNRRDAECDARCDAKSASHLVFPVKDYPLSKLSVVYATQSEQKWLRSLIWGFDVCTLDGDVFVDLAKSADAS